MKRTLISKIMVGAMSAAMTLTMIPAGMPAFAAAKKAKTPAKVQILTPKVKGTKVQVRWKKAANAVKYRVYYKVNKGAWSSVTVSGSASSYTTKSLGYSKTVSVKAAGVNGKLLGKASAVKTVKTAARPSSSDSTTSGKVNTSKIPTGKKNFLYTADGKKVWVGKTYDTSYWGDTRSHRRIYVTYIPKIEWEKGYDDYNGGDRLTGIDVKNGGTYTASICTAENNNREEYKLGSACCLAEYSYHDKLFTSGIHKGDIKSVRIDKQGYGAATWYSYQSIQILRDDVTIVETIDGTEPTFDHYYGKYTKASTNGDTFSAYNWFDASGYQWIRMYEGNKLTYEKIVRYYSGDEYVALAEKEGDAYRD
ncbi:MAG: hypothetical protein ACI4W2_00205 [Eubacterium sp.]